MGRIYRVKFSLEIIGEDNLFIRHLWNIHLDFISPVSYTHLDVYKRQIHYCVPNVLSRVARTASIAYSNVFLPMLQHIARQGGFTNAIRMDAGLREGVYPVSYTHLDVYKRQVVR